MKLTEDTINLLQNFATINSNLVVSEGNELSTIAVAHNVMAKVTVPENFEQEFGIYDLSEFLGALNLVDGPDLNFAEGNVKIKGTSSEVSYTFSDKELLTYPKKDITMPEDCALELTLTEDILNKVRKAAATLGHSVVSLNASAGKVLCTVEDTSTPGSNSFSLELGECDKALDCNCHYLISNLKLISGDYTVKISDKLISEWKNSNDVLTYWIALESTSTFN